MRYILSTLLIAFTLQLRAQVPTENDSLTLPSDTIYVKRGDKIMTLESYAARYNPRKAMLLGAVLPGAGQAYNNKYWKIPLVYGGFFGTGFAIDYNQKRFLHYKGLLYSLLNEPLPVIFDKTNTTPSGNKFIGGQLSTATGLKVEQLRNLVNRYRRDRDFAVIMTFIWYMLQMVDAHIDAHLKEFDVNPQLKVALEPAMRQYAFGRSTGLSLTFKF